MVTPGSGSALDRHHDRGRGVLQLIALFKFTKVVLLVAVACGALRLLDPDISARALQWTTAIATDSDRRFVQHFVALALGLSPRRLEILALGAFLYAALFATEGVGLWLGRRWAEYLTVVATATFVPIELFEVIQRVTLPRATALGLNIAVLVYLICHLLPRWRAHRAQALTP